MLVMVKSLQLSESSVVYLSFKQRSGTQTGTADCQWVVLRLWWQSLWVPCSASEGRDIESGSRRLAPARYRIEPNSHCVEVKV